MDFVVPERVAATELDRRLEQMPSKWRALLGPHLQTWVDRGVFFDVESGAIFVGHRPTIAPFNYAFTLFPPVKPEDIERYESVVEVTLPSTVKDYLQAFNGGHFYEFGVRGAEMFYSYWPWPDKRAFWHCQDMGGEYKIIQRRKATRGNPMVFATRNSSLNGVQRYFQSDEQILSVDDKGKLCDRWVTVVDWVGREIDAAAAFTEEWRHAMEALNERYPPKPLRRRKVASK